MAKQTLKDFEREVLRVKMRFQEDLQNYGWKYTFETTKPSEQYHVFTITNTAVSNIITYDELMETVSTNIISTTVMKRITELQAKLEGGSL
jgi:predicted DNA-binding ArsR family transcriptional regulator